MVFRKKTQNYLDRMLQSTQLNNKIKDPCCCRIQSSTYKNFKFLIRGTKEFSIIINLIKKEEQDLCSGGEIIETKEVYATKFDNYFICSDLDFGLNTDTNNFNIIEIKYPSDCTIFVC